MNENTTQKKFVPYGLLATLWEKDPDFEKSSEGKDCEVENFNDDIVYVVRACQYLEHVSGRRLVPNTPTCYSLSVTDLHKAVTEFTPSAKSIEEKILAKEIANLCVRITYKELPLTGPQLLASCRNWRPFHGAHGRNAREDMLSEVFAYVFNCSPGFRTSILQYIGFDLAENAKAETQQFEKSKTVPGKQNRWDIRITAGAQVCIIETKIDAPLTDKEMVRYPNDCKTNGWHYLLMTPNGSEAMRDAIGDTPRHLSCTTGNSSVVQVVDKAIATAKDDVERLYLQYFVTLLKSSVVTRRELVTFAEMKESLDAAGVLVHFERLASVWSDASLGGKKRGYLPGKDGCIFFNVSAGDQWSFPFKIKTSGNLYVQWLGGNMQSDNELKVSIMEKVRDAAGEAFTGKQSVVLKRLTASQLDALANCLKDLAEMINVKH